MPFIFKWYDFEQSTLLVVVNRAEILTKPNYSLHSISTECNVSLQTNKSAAWQFIPNI